MRKIVGLAVLALIGAVGLIGLGPGSSSFASTGTLLPITSYYQMVVDPTHGHIFISQGNTTQDAILVTDLSGQVVTSITGQTGVMGIALSPDGSTLYAALRGGGAVSAIDTTTLTQTASYPLPAGDSPRDVAVQSGKIWVSFDTGTLFAAGIGFFDPSMSSPTLQTPAAMGGWEASPQLAVDPGDAGILVATSQFGGLASYDTSTNPVSTLAGSTEGPTGCAGQTDLAVAPGGAEFAVACHSAGFTDLVYSTASLIQLHSLGSPVAGVFSEAVAYDAAADVATGFDTFVPNPDLYVFSDGSTTALSAYALYTLSFRGGILQPRGLAWAPDGSQLFGVLGQGLPATSFLLAAIPSPVAPPAVPEPTSTSVFCGGGAVTVGQAVTCIATVTDTARDGLAAPTGTITFMSDTGGGSFSNDSCTLSASGEGQASCSITYTPGQVGTGSHTITGSYQGDFTHAGSTGQGTIIVTLRATAIDVSCQKVNPVSRQCTATVIDTSPGTFAPPTGTVSFSTSGRGFFIASQCTLSGAGNATSCAVDYETPPGVPFKGQTITATYAGDSTHQAGSSSTPLS